MALIEARDLHKSYRNGSVVTPVLHGIDLAVESGEFVAIMGPSGCGKSTLLYVLGLLAHHDSGQVVIEGKPVSHLSDVDRTRLRRMRMGFIFQRFNLLPALSAADNVHMTLRLRGESDPDAVRDILGRVGLGEKVGKRPSMLSIGEQQRVAIARSLVGRPALLFADEPTGNLDSDNGRKVLELLSHFHRTNGQTILMVTHSDEAAHWADRVVRMRDGRCVDE